MSGEYLQEINRGMRLLNEAGCIFIGQAVEYKGTGITHQIKALENPRVLELPVCEELQSGMALGMAITGDKVVSIYPRFDFAILACNQLINHIDKWADLHGGNPKVITKICIGSTHPLNAGFQHTMDHSEAFRLMCKNTKVYNLLYKHRIYDSYQKALYEDGPAVLIEHGDLYT